ncbi:S8 family serine peptidase [Streptomyces sp. NPDC049954]|uniref:S8 family serine peptidase n=1 Tax=Streptomyces sp. NPDC049954 TaxID=3155779 RepID=UPI003435C343
MTYDPGLRRLTVVAAAVALVAGAALPVTATAAAPAPDARPSAREVLASLDGQEIDALHRMAALDLGGLHVTDRAALRSDRPVNVIVQLRTPPARTARLLAAADGRSLSDADANAAVQKAHQTFQGALDGMFPKTETKTTSPSGKSAKPGSGSGSKGAAGSGNAVHIHRSYTRSFDGVSLSLPGNRIADLLDHDEVTAVWPDTKVKALADHGQAATGAAVGGTDTSADDEALTRLHAEGVTGKGVKVGVIDTGIDYHHPDLRAVYQGGYDFVDDDSDPMETTYADWKASGQAETNGGETYYTQHGTHVAGIIAGQGDRAVDRAAHGVAPGARLYAYRALGPYGGGSTSDILAAMDRAAEDGMDVVNMSLGASVNDPLSPEALAADNLVLAGVTTVIAAGNSGPDARSLATPGAAALPLTVGAHDAPLTLPAYTLTAGAAKAQGRLLAQPYGDALDRLDGTSLPVVDAGTGTAAGYSGKDVTGKAALVRRGGITLDEKVRRARSEGAAAVLLVNDDADADEGHIPFYIGEGPSYVPAFSVTATDGAALAAADAPVSFTAAGTFRLGSGALADFSSRGPVYGTSAIKPEITGPGVSVLSSVPADVVDPAGGDYTYAYARLSGTSMATPFLAGTAALMLQHDPGLTPDGIKTALMNTATALPGEVSVFDQGAGAVDPYAAVHTTATLQVPATTPYVTLDGTSTRLDERTGALDLGVLPLGQKSSRQRGLTLVNEGRKPVTYEIATGFSRGSGGSEDAAAAHVTLTTEGRVTVGARGRRTLHAELRVPAGAPAGSYEGHVTATPVKGTDAAALRVPFGLRVARSGFAELDMTKPVLSTGRNSPDGAVGGGAATFDLKMAGQLRSVDIFLTDKKGRDLGYVGGVNTTGLTEGVLYGPATVGPWYFPLTGDKATPVDPRGRWMPDGAYRLRIVGTDADGGTDTALRDIYVDSKVPSYDDPYGTWDPAHPVVVEHPAADTTFHVGGTLRDGETGAIHASGLDIGQDDNVLHYSYNNANAPTGRAPVAADGTVDAELPLSAGPPTATFKLWPADAAGNIGGVRVINTVKDDVPYVVGDAGAAAARPGDKVTYTLTAHDLRHWKSYTTQIRYNADVMKLLDIAPTGELAAHDPSAVRTTADVSAGSSSYRTVAFDVPDPDGLTADSMPLLKVTYEVTGRPGTASAGLITGTTSAVDTSGTKVPLNIQFYGSVRLLNATSSFSARPAAEALLTKGYAFDTGRDYSADGFRAKLTAPDGTSRALTADSTARMSADGIQPADEPYRFEVAVPGHFTWHEDVGLALHGAFGTAGTSAGSDPALVAGDVNGDDVVDVRDAAAVYAARTTYSRAADIDHDGTVGRKDLAWVKANYLRQNSTADHYTDPVKKWHGRTLEDYLDLM